jgi:hypothetical protein
MTLIENSRAVAQQLVSIAKQQGVDLEPLRDGDTFLTDQRFVWIWRKDESPSRGPEDQETGTLNYNMQGVIAVLPSVLKDSASAFRGSWFERGTFDNIEQAVNLVKAWLLDKKEVDDLPARRVRAYGI